MDDVLSPVAARRAFLLLTVARWFPVPGAEYGFCRTCGASLFWRADAWPDVLSICAGTLDPPTGLHTVQAWWVSQASDYFVRADLPELDTE